MSTSLDAGADQASCKRACLVGEDDIALQLGLDESAREAAEATQAEA